GTVCVSVLLAWCLVFSLFSSAVSRVFFCCASVTPVLYSLSLHDALPIYVRLDRVDVDDGAHVGELALLGDVQQEARLREARRHEDRESTRLNSSHVEISYAVFCLKKNRQRRRNGGRWRLLEAIHTPVHAK